MCASVFMPFVCCSVCNRLFVLSVVVQFTHIYTRKLNSPPKNHWLSHAVGYEKPKIKADCIRTTIKIIKLLSFLSRSSSCEAALELEIKT